MFFIQSPNRDPGGDGVRSPLARVASVILRASGRGFGTVKGSPPFFLPFAFFDGFPFAFAFTGSATALTVASASSLASSFGSWVLWGLEPPARPAGVDGDSAESSQPCDWRPRGSACKSTDHRLPTVDTLDRCKAPQARVPALVCPQSKALTRAVGGMLVEP